MRNTKMRKVRIWQNSKVQQSRSLRGKNQVFSKPGGKGVKPVGPGACRQEKVEETGI